MGASDFDAVSALKDLSNSAPPTPSKYVLHPRETSKDSVPFSNEEAVDEKVVNDSPEEKKKTSFFAKVKAKVDERDTE